MKPKRGFTLVELMIVVTMLAIIASLVLPRFTTASSAAKVSASDVQLNAVRKALKRYEIDHGNFPPIGDLWTVVMTKTDAAGNVDANGMYGPYIAEEPKNPWNRSATVHAASSAGGATQGWAYDAATGSIGLVGYDEETETFQNWNYVKIMNPNTGLYTLVSSGS